MSQVGTVVLLCTIGGVIKISGAEHAAVIWGRVPFHSADVDSSLSSGVESVVLSWKAAAAIKTGGEVVTWGSPAYGGDSSSVARELSANVTRIYNNFDAFAALKVGGQVVTWGDPDNGGDSSHVAAQLGANVTDIIPNAYAFAALKTGGEVITWGDPKTGGDSSAVSAQLKANVTAIHSNSFAYAALKAGGEIVTWGTPQCGGNSSRVAAQLKANVTSIFFESLLDSSCRFIAWKPGGEIVTWGDDISGGDSSSVGTELKADVTGLVTNHGAVAALKKGGKVVTWGENYLGGDSSKVASELRADVERVFANAWSFAALKKGGQVVTWGDKRYGGDSSEVASQLRSGVIDIIVNARSFAALKQGGQVVTWGEASHGGDSKQVAHKLRDNVVKVFPNRYAFAALKEGGEVVTWGHERRGGDSSNVAAQLEANVTGILSAGGGSFVALKDGRQIVAWGHDDFLPSALVLSRMQGRMISVNTSNNGIMLDLKRPAMYTGYAAFICIPTGERRSACQPCPSNEVWNPEKARCQLCGDVDMMGDVPDSDQASCIPCGQGSALHDDGSTCVPCTGRMFSDEWDQSCKECPAGQIPEKNRSTCGLCQKTFVPNDEGGCVQCRLARTAQPGDDKCSLDSLAILSALLMAASMLVFLQSLELCLWGVQVEDIGTLVKHKLIVQTTRTLGLVRYRQQRNMHVYFYGTGIRFLDVKGRPWHCRRQHMKFVARPLSSDRFEVLGFLNGDQIPDKPGESSMGHFCLSKTTLFTHDTFRLMAVIVCFGASLVSGWKVANRWFYHGLAAGGVLGAILHVIVANFRPKSSIHRLHKDFIKDIVKHNPFPASVEPGAGRALKIDKLLYFQNFFKRYFGERTMYYVEPIIIRPVTKQFQLSFAEVVGPNNVNFFVSHYWGTPFVHFLKTLTHHANGTSDSAHAGLGMEGTYWICSFCNNQWKIKEDIPDGDWQRCSFYRALTSPTCLGTVMVLDSDALPLERIWCIFEVLQTLKLKKCKTNFQGLLYATDRGVLNRGEGSVDVAVALGDKIAHLKVEDAQASKQADKDMISGLIIQENGGFKLMNSFLRRNMEEALEGIGEHVKNRIASIGLTLALGGEEGVALARAFAQRCLLRRFWDFWVECSAKVASMSPKTMAGSTHAFNGSHDDMDAITRNLGYTFQDLTHSIYSGVQIPFYESHHLEQMHPKHLREHAKLLYRTIGERVGSSVPEDDHQLMEYITAVNKAHLSAAERRIDREVTLDELEAQVLGKFAL